MRALKYLGSNRGWRSVPLLPQTQSGFSIVWLRVAASKQPSERASAVVGHVALWPNKKQKQRPLCCESSKIRAPSSSQPISDDAAHPPYGCSSVGLSPGLQGPKHGLLGSVSRVSFYETDCSRFHWEGQRLLKGIPNLVCPETSKF